MKARGKRWEGEREDRGLARVLPPFPSSHRPPRTYFFLRLLLPCSCGMTAEAPLLASASKTTQVGSPRYCLYGLNKNRNEVYKKEAVALDKCQTATVYSNTVNPLLRGWGVGGGGGGGGGI